MKHALSLLLLFWAWSTLAQKGITTQHAMVVSARIEASEIGAEIMKKGGNAFDAMIATELALAVAYPYAGNIGGGGFMVYRQANGTTGALDYREKAPSVAHQNMYLNAQGEPIEKRSTHGVLSVGVPGTIAGLFAVHQKYGTLPMNTLMAPAIALAKRGVVITERQLQQINKNQPEIIQVSGPNTWYAQTFHIGDTIKYPALAHTLERISQNGLKEFYQGETAQKLVGFLQQKGGIISLEDLKNYTPVWRKPHVFKFKKWRIISMSPPSSGGITLHQIMQMISPYNLKKYGHNQTRYVQLITEAERRAYADRNYFLGDPDFVKIPTSQLVDKSYLKQRMKSFSFEKATPSVQVSHGTIDFSESDETTHYSIVDALGNAVAVTTTLNGAYGSKLYCDELGFFLNNEMDDFSLKPGTPNSYGLVGAQANSIAPNKRMLSSMTPTIVEKGGKLEMVLGSPGGSTIITSVLQTILNKEIFGMSMQQAVDAPRFHHQWLPDEITFEPDSFNAQTLRQLQEHGYKTVQKEMPVIGKVDAIYQKPDGSLEAGADKRGDDAAAGF
ncbi:gamma-glutamyltransferase [Flavobacterium sp. CYK-55]|uniref:gamma-glutamyltransferase n=1 Tax=Flavobacterium sp. CYK-55 TaxID=2835529 RepID=UPI001BCEAA4F|nr:gamma-glutamyltransferase [Flavobacterium sp. CYK-55]MBS7788039.1 gamma-glutamyltransferase [Flavobacterium sp. CYK-55]